MRWEYDVKSIPSPDEDLAGLRAWLDAKGAGGWELVGIQTRRGETYAYFKRPVEGQCAGCGTTCTT